MIFHDFPYHISDEQVEGMHPLFLCFPSSLDSLSGDHREICRRRALHRFGHGGALGRRILRLLLLLREALMPGHFGLGAQLAVLVLEKGRHVAAKKDGLDVEFYIWNQSITVLSLCYQLELT